MKVLSVARYTFIGNLRNRIFLVLILFGFLLIGSSLLLGLLSQEQEIRMLLDVGLAAIEKLSLLCAIFLIVNLILEEIESKSLYLVLTRSLTRSEYLLGRFLGAMASVFTCAILMVLAHLSLLYFKGWRWDPDGTIYCLSVFMSLEKVFLISSVALFFSLFSSSAVVALVFSFFVWVLGHFAMELRFLSQNVQQDAAKLFFKFFYFLIPHFQYLNARDLWIAASDRLPAFVVQGTAYTILYSALSLGLATLIFQRKEF
ncbi:MAG: ABC transporter permease subunit [Elusimicrobia bacterium]|nr:ABC transporter permease subunit [Elusimicrobiota bacterium]MBI2916013.1 ABC transporter permease subunit [Elusimicrobiota bacterium]MBI3013254.1 ABC transporter permease subunit [Elusimicrobiota bacterium]